MKTISAIAAAVLIAGCSPKPIETRKTDNAEVKAELIATVDGCRIFRLSNGWTSMYFAHCPLNATVQWDETCGKGCVKRVQSLSAVGTK